MHIAISQRHRKTVGASIRTGISSPHSCLIELLFGLFAARAAPVVGQEDGPDIDLLEETAQHFYLALASIAVDGAGVTPTEALRPFFGVDTELTLS